MVICNATRRDSGGYAGAVSNPGGTTTSSNANVLILVPQNLTNPTLAKDGQFTLLSGDADSGPLSAADLPRFSVLTSTNLVDWTRLGHVLQLTNGLLFLADPEATNHLMRFYRVEERFP